MAQIFLHFLAFFNQKKCPGRGSNLQPLDYKVNAHPTELPQLFLYKHEKVEKSF